MEHFLSNFDGGNMLQPIIRLENVSKYYTGTGGVGLGLRRVNAEFYLGEFVIITGPSGSGKTTLLNVISGMDRYEEGTLFVEGEDTTYFGQKDYEEYRRNYISFIFQNYNLIDSYTVFENVELALIAKGVAKEERLIKANQIIEEVGLTNRKKHRVTHLSGGEKQRVAIARALASDALVLVCDEITGNLDQKTSSDIIALLKRVSKGKLVLFVTHDPGEATKYATRIITMHDGSIENNTKLINEELSIDSKVKEAKAISNKSVLALSFKSLIRTPRKSLLMFFIILISTFLCAYAYSIYANFDQSLKGSFDMGFSEFNYYDGRIIVKKSDKSDFSSNDIASLQQIAGVKNVIESDLALDVNARYYIKSIEYSTTSALIRSSNDLKRTNLAYGRLPIKENEVVIEVRKNDSSLKDLIDEEIRLAFDYYDEVLDMKIVGIIETLKNLPNIYLHQDLLKEINKRTISSFSTFTFITDKSKLPNNGFLFPFNNDVSGFIVFEKASLTDLEVEIEVFTKGSNGEYSYSTKMEYKNIYQEVVFDNLNAKVIPIEFVREMDYHDWRSYVENRYEPLNKIFLSPSNIQKLGLDKNFQVSITAEVNDVNKVANLIEKGQFLALPLSNISPSNLLDSFVVFLQIIIMFLVIGLIGGIYFLTYFSLRNIVLSHQKGYLVMRSLGIDGKKISMQVYLSHLLISILSFTILLITWILFHQRYRMNFFEPIMKLTFAQLLLIGGISTILALLLANRFSKKILAETIVAKVME